MQDPLVYVEREEDDDAVIGVDRKGFVCFYCNFGRHDCRHVMLLKNLLHTDPIPDSLCDIVKQNETLKSLNARIYVKPAISTQKISWKTDYLQRGIYDGTFEDIFIRHPAGGFYCVPDFNGDICEVCKSALEPEICWENSTIRLLTRVGIKFVHGK